MLSILSVILYICSVYAIVYIIKSAIYAITMTLSTTASERNSERLTELNVKCAEMSMSQQSERVDSMSRVKADSLMSLIDRKEVEATTRNSNYNKRALPFDRENTKHVEALQAMCDMFVDPWASSKIKREDLTDCVSDFILSIKYKKNIVISSEDFDTLFALAKCETDRREAEQAKKASKKSKRKKKTTKKNSK